MKFSIILPAYNEEKAIGQTIDNLKDMLAKNNYDAEIIAVDDGSRDSTFDIAESKAVTVLRHPRNLGYGQTLKTGINVASNEIIVILDSDESYPVDEIPNLLKEIERYDMVIGARIIKNSLTAFPRKISKFFLRKLGEYLVEARIPDINSGLRAFRKSVYSKYAHCIPSGFSFTMTITLAFMHDYKSVKFVPVSYYKRSGLSKIRPIRDTINFFFVIIRTSVYFRPIKVFAPIAFLLFLAAVIVSFYSIFFAGKFFDTSVTLLFVLGIQTVIFALLADLINRKIR